jgi:hypothetical protein
LIIPIKLRNCFFLVGGWIFNIACTFFGSGWIPSLVIQYPKYSSSVHPKKDFFAFTFRPANTSSNLSK